MSKELNLSSEEAKAGIHVRLEKAEEDLKLTKSKIYNEIMGLSNNLDKIVEVLSPDQIKKVRGILENMAYEIGKIKGRAQ